MTDERIQQLEKAIKQLADCVRVEEGVRLTYYMNYPECEESRKVISELCGYK